MEKDREEWSREVERQRQERMEAIRERSRLAREKLLQKEKEAADHQNMVEEMLKDFHRLNPEWEARRQNVLRVSAGYYISRKMHLIGCVALPFSSKRNALEC